MTNYSVSLSVNTEDPQVLAKVSESFARTAAGLAMEKIQTSISVVGWDEEDE